MIWPLSKIDHLALGSNVGAVASAYVAYWHIGHLGLLSFDSAARSEPDVGGQTQACGQELNEIANWIVMLTNANVAVLRPILDIQHIEFFLLAEVFRNAGRIAEIKDIVGALVDRLYLRRLGRNPMPFLDGGNSLDNVFEHVATKPSRPVILAQSSFFVLMLLEVCFVLSDDARDALITLIHRRLVLGGFDQGDPGDSRPLDLMSWIPPDDWWMHVLDDEMAPGQCVAVTPFASSRLATAGEILPRIRKLVLEMREARAAFSLPEDLPVSALILASLRHRRPLPPELWRRWAFPHRKGAVD
jgi:hypothetical protein